jgi:hypothetical protein
MPILDSMVAPLVAARLSDVIAAVSPRFPGQDRLVR